MRYTLIAAITARIMNQINLDALLPSQATVTGGTLAPLKLQPDLSYQAMLAQGRDGKPQLQINTPQGIALVSLSPTQAALLNAALGSSANAPNLPLVNAATSALTAGTTISLPLTPQLTVQLTPVATPVTASTAQNAQASFQVQLTPQPDGQLLLQPQAKASTQMFNIAPAQVLLLLQSLQSLQSLRPLQSQQSLAAAQRPSGDTTASNPLTFAVTLQRQDQHLLLTLANQRQLQLPLNWLPPAAQWPAQSPMAAQLLLQATAGQLQVQILLPGSGKAEAAVAAASSAPINTELTAKTGPLSPTAAATPVTGAETAGITHKSVPLTLSVAQSRQLVPTLVAATQSTANAELPGSAKAAASSISATASPALQQAMPVQWRLHPPAKAGADWQLELSASPQTPAPAAPLKVDSSQLNRPLQWQAAASPAQPLPQAGKAAAVDVAPLWRQLLPLSQAVLDPLRPDAELPPAVQAVLTEIRQQSLDSGKAISSQQLLQQQLTAALQFNPQPQLSPVATPAAAATLALAIQLLLGRLSQQAPTEQKTPASAKLQQLIGQLEPQQSSQLLRQLAGHASTMQGAQLATIEQQQQPGQNQQLFIQLPLLQQGDSRFAELALTEREADGSTPGQKRTQWQLTMKFDLASQGKLLVQVRLTGLEVSLQFYTEQTGPLAMAQQFLPLLKDRLKMQGLEVTEAQCQLGKIPSQLYQRNNSLLAVKV